MAECSKLLLLMEQGPDQGYSPKLANSTFIADSPEEKEAANREFKRVGINLN